MTPTQRARLCDAADALTQAPCGGVGEDGHTLDELDAEYAAGRVPCDDATYAACQRAWRLIERALQEDRTCN